MSWDNYNNPNMNADYGNYNDQNFNAGYDQNYYNPNDYYSQDPVAPPAPPPPSQSHPQEKMSNVPFLDNPMMADMAMNYGQNLMGQYVGQEQIKKNLDKYTSWIHQLRYYFAVDTAYVGRKLTLILFPFTRTEWSVKYNQNEPVQPKLDINAPDLYIPIMAYVTYVLIAGYVMGIQNAFSPDALATVASSTLVWLILEIAVIYLTLTLMSISTNLCKWDVLSFSTYKYVGIIFALLVGLTGSNTCYYVALAYVSSALIFFLIRTLRLRIESGAEVTSSLQGRGKRKIYIILLYSSLQPLLMWWMTYALVPSYVTL